MQGTATLDVDMELEEIWEGPSLDTGGCGVYNLYNLIEVAMSATFPSPGPGPFSLSIQASSGLLFLLSLMRAFH